MRFNYIKIYSYLLLLYNVLYTLNDVIRRSPFLFFY